MPAALSRWLAVVMTVTLVACASSNLPDNSTATERPAATRSQPSVLATPTEQASVTARAISDLATRLGVPSSEIKVVTQETVTWPDGGLGCPQPGINYNQVQVDGLRIVLRHAGTTYEYHTGQSRLVLCETMVSKPALTSIPLQPNEDSTPEVNVTSTQQVEPGLQPLIDAAITDLARRLSIDRSAIEVVSAQSVVWPDRSLGCPQPGMVYPQVLAEGYHIELRVNGQVYSYHGGEGRGPFLCENPSK
jgi:hypothetical protein